MSEGYRRVPVNAGICRLTWAYCSAPVTRCRAVPTGMAEFCEQIVSNRRDCAGQNPVTLDRCLHDVERTILRRECDADSLLLHGRSNSERAIDARAGAARAHRLDSSGLWPVSRERCSVRARANVSPPWVHLLRPEHSAGRPRTIVGRDRPGGRDVARRTSDVGESAVNDGEPGFEATDVQWADLFAPADNSLHLPAVEHCIVRRSVSPIVVDSVATPMGDVPAHVPVEVDIHELPSELRLLELNGDLASAHAGRRP